MNKIIFNIIALLIFSSCTDFLDRAPQDSLTTNSFWKTERQAYLALIGCYNGFESGEDVLYRDCGSDNAYNYHRHEGWQALGDGSMSPGDPGHSDFYFTTIRRCNEFLGRIEGIDFLNSSVKANYIAEVRFIRAYRYFILNQSYGAVPILTIPSATPEEAMVSRNPSKEVTDFIIKELEELTPDLMEKNTTSDYGRITQNAGRALLLRMYLFQKQFDKVVKLKDQIVGADLVNSYEDLFLYADEVNNEVLLSVQQLENDYSIDFTPFLPNSAGGWSSVVPLQSLVDSYETIEGLTIEEAKGVGKYDESNPFVNRDPRLRNTIIYPGQNWEGRIYSSINDGDKDHPSKADNATKSGYNFKKYFNNLKQFPAGFYNTGRDIMLLRYAEVLLSYAEAKIELNQLDDNMYKAVDRVRTRAGLPEVDRVKYSTQSKLRELVRRERRVEFAFEGLRRYDVVRWGIGPEVMNGPTLGARNGSILETSFNSYGDRNLSLNGTQFEVEKERKFTAGKHELFPIPQTAIDKNPNLKPNNPGYN